MDTYEKKYKEALLKAREAKQNTESAVTIGILEEIFPELKESEDERMKKELIKFLQECHNIDSGFFSRYCEIPFAQMLAWLEKQGTSYTKRDVDDAYVEGMAFAKGELEKQGEQKPVDKVEPKFKVGDWIISKYMHLVMQIINNDNGSYKTVGTDGTERNDSYDFIERNFKLWNIQCAWDGDVLASKDGESILIFRNLDTSTSFSSYYNIEGKGEFDWFNDCFIPATKEQRNTLMKAMADAGWEFDFGKKELKKIEQKPTQEIEPFEAEHGKYYYCIKDYFCGGRKQASKGDVVQALRGLPIMGLKDASEYFLPVNSVKCNSTWSEEDEVKINRIVACLENLNIADNDILLKDVNWLKSFKERIGG